jgi:hypothetical protein
MSTIRQFNPESSDRSSTANVLVRDEPDDEEDEKGDDSEEDDDDDSEEGEDDDSEEGEDDDGYSE